MRPSRRPRESVWDYPRPPRLEPDDRRVVVRVGDRVLADSITAIRVLETSHPPVFYLPPQDVATEMLSPGGPNTVCEFKGAAIYWDLTGEVRIPGVAWSYPRPTTRFADIRDWLGFYPSKVECYVAGERVESQEGGFYGGWITPEITGPFKGGAGTLGW